MDNKINLTAAIMGFTAIVLGAFGAHALKNVLTIAQLNSFETGVKYQIYHAFFLFIVSLNTKLSEKSKKTVFYLISFGVLLFSGSIYLLSTADLTGIHFKSFGIVTPIGGALLLLGWGVFAKFFIKKYE